MSITQDQLAKRLREAREKAGFTQEDAAKALGLVRPAIAQIEAGKRKVSSIELMKLARLYGRPPQDFFEETFERDGAAHIWRAMPEARCDPKVQQAMNRGLEIVNEILSLEGVLGIARAGSVLPQYNLTPLRHKWDAVIQGKERAEQERGRLQLGTAPIEDPAAILESQGVLVLALILPAEVSGFTYISKHNATCVINASHPRVRQRFSLAHEYCHAICDMTDSPGIVSREDRTKDRREVRADAFAADFLMPEEGVKGFFLNRGKAWPARLSSSRMIYEKQLPYEARRSSRTRKIDLVDVVQFADYFGVSREAAIWRTFNLQLINADEKELLFAQEKEGYGKRIDDLIGARDTECVLERSRRLQYAELKLFSLALEAAKLEAISRRKLIELLKLAGLTEDEIYGLPLLRRTPE